MQASIAYLLVLLGTALGIALGGIVGGFVGGVGFFLLHRVYTLSKRLAAIDERLRHLEPLPQENLPTPVEAPAPAPTPAQTAPVSATPLSSPPAHPSDASPTPPPVTQPPAEPAADPIVALNATLQSLLPALSALSANTSASPQTPPQPTIPPPVVPQPTPPQPVAHSEPHIHIEKGELAEATAAAIAIEHVLLNALRDSTLHAQTTHPKPEPSAPTPVQADALLAAAAQDAVPAEAIHVNTTAPINPAPSPNVANDLEHLRDELTTLMSDISAERARHTQEPPKTSGNALLADAKTMQELLVELRGLTAQMPPSPPSQP